MVIGWLVVYDHYKFEPRFILLHSGYHWPCSLSLAPAPTAATSVLFAAGRPVSDTELLAATAAELGAFAAAARPAPGAEMALVETAGGPASPGPSGRIQVPSMCPQRAPWRWFALRGLVACDAAGMRGRQSRVLWAPPVSLGKCTWDAEKLC